MTHPSLPRDRRVEADFSESAETAAAVSQLEVEPWRWLHDPRMVGLYGEYDAGRCCQKRQPCLTRLVLGPMFQSHIIRLVGCRPRYDTVGPWLRTEMLVKTIRRSTSGSKLPEL